MCVITFNVADGQTNGQRTFYGNTAHCVSSRGENGDGGCPLYIVLVHWLAAAVSRGPYVSIKIMNSYNSPAMMSVP